MTHAQYIVCWLRPDEPRSCLANRAPQTLTNREQSGSSASLPNRGMDALPRRVCGHDLCALPAPVVRAAGRCRQRRHRRPAGGAAGRRRVRRPGRRLARAGYGRGATGIPAARRPGARRHRRPPHAPRSRTLRAAGARGALTRRRCARLGRRRAPVQARLARLPVRALRRRLRPAPGGSGAPLPAFRPLAADRYRRAPDAGRAATGAADQPARSRPAGRRGARGSDSGRGAGRSMPASTSWPPPARQ